MRREEVIEVLDEYADANSEQKLIELLKEKMIDELDGWEVTSDRQKHNLNMVLRDLEEELDYIETSKLAEFDPEQQ